MTTNGRRVPDLPEHLFRDSGITIRIRKIGPATQQMIAEQVLADDPKPQPPIVSTELGPEANAADPDYGQRIEEWDTRTTKQLNQRLLILACLEAEFDVDRDAIARKRRHFARAGIRWSEPPDLDADEQDRVFYIEHIAVATTDDLREFYEALTRRSQPTEAAVERHIETFPG